MRLDATEANLAFVAAVATGAADALKLNLEPAIRLRTITLEAAGNVVAHAYPERPGGPLEMQIRTEPGSRTNPGAERKIHVVVRDEGIGCGLPPSAADPPGLGLPMICTLSEAYTLTRGIEGGTSFDATIVPDAEPDRLPEPPAPPDACRLEFGDSAFLQPVLTRAIAAGVSGEEGSSDVPIDRLRETVGIGDAIATSIGLEDGSTPVPGMTLLRGTGSSTLSISIGPLFAGAAERLIERVRFSGNAEPQGLTLETEPTSDGRAIARIDLPLPQL